ncbi:hypothetical protein J5N97_010368 [Dioscorea zingiberensis]|uniref:MADS-box domain-containing protein n=1 Tax=Dioscorea zingiberensis TaxID=325984 RepID=A0A9D5HML2_9LILI|nr:hypothetical protein J5N97_010368 [Dioscorea zingiberensis]
MNIPTRTKGLLKKASELSTLCDIDVCLIFYDSSSSTAPAHTFPSDLSQVNRILSRYRTPTGRVKDETSKYLHAPPPPPPREPRITPIDDAHQPSPETGPDLDLLEEGVIRSDPVLDEEPMRTLVDLVGAKAAEAALIASGESGISSFSCREEALRIIGDDLRDMLDAVRTKIINRWVSQYF